MTKFIPYWVLVKAVGLGFFATWARLCLVQTSYQIDKLQRQIQNTKASYQTLLEQLHQLKSTENLKMIGTKEFHLHAPKPSQIVRLSDPLSSE